MNYLIIGLGNPGTEYKKTRHNAGWFVIDEIYPNASFVHDAYARADVAQEGMVTIAKPTTFMNLSGVTAQYFVEKKEYLPEHIIVIYDDIDLPLGKFKISFDRGSGGHNGIKSLESCLGSRGFIRIRIGISKTLEDGSIIKPNVLGNFEQNELEQISEISKKVKLAIATIIKDGKEYAMTEFNSDAPHVKLLKNK